MCLNYKNHVTRHLYPSDDLKNIVSSFADTNQNFKNLKLLLPEVISVHCVSSIDIGEPGE
jgi:hypothetical protein